MRNHVVIGATGGIGSALVEQLAAEDTRIMVAARNEQRLAEVASLRAWRLGPDSRWMTGEALRIDGGMSQVRTAAR